MADFSAAAVIAMLAVVLIGEAGIAMTLVTRGEMKNYVTSRLAHHRAKHHDGGDDGTP